MRIPGVNSAKLKMLETTWKSTLKQWHYWLSMQVAYGQL